MYLCAFLFVLYKCQCTNTKHIRSLALWLPLVVQELLNLPEPTSSPPVFRGVCVTRSLVFLCVCFVHFLLAVVLSVLLPYKNSDWPFGIFKHFVYYKHRSTLKNRSVCDRKSHQFLNQSKWIKTDILSSSFHHMQPGFLNATHFLARKRSLGIKYVKNDSCFRDHHCLTINVVLWVILGAGCVSLSMFLVFFFIFIWKVFIFHDNTPYNYLVHVTWWLVIMIFV
jgi:hypothetical protein